MAFGPIGGAIGRGFASGASRRAFFAKLGRGGSSGGSRLARGRARRAGERRAGRRGRRGGGRGDGVSPDESDAMVEEGCSEAGENAFAKAGNEGQTTILENCVDGWVDYAIGQMLNDEEIDQAELEGMCSHPEAVSEILVEFIDECYEFSGE